MTGLDIYICQSEQWQLPHRAARRTMFIHFGKVTGMELEQGSIRLAPF